MPDYQALENKFQQILDLKRRPVAVAFRAEVPEGAEQFSGSEPAGCSFWRLAAEGRTLATAPSDHYNCPIGSYTHNIPLPENRAKELPAVLETMVESGLSEDGGGARHSGSSQTRQEYCVRAAGRYAGGSRCGALRGAGGQAHAPGRSGDSRGRIGQASLLARPTCMAIPAALAHGMVTSAGCIGNRVYTGVGNDEMYAAVPGRALEQIARELETVESANLALAQYHQDRQHRLSTV